MKRKTGQIIPCKYCGKDFYLPRWQAEKGGKYCSHFCHSKDIRIPRIRTACVNCGREFEASQCEIRRGSGRTCSKECSLAVARIAAAKWMKESDESEHSRWKGEKVGYYGVHDWITKHYGQPIGCEVCGTTDSNRTYNWANLSHEYKRDINDFKRMCMSCHRKYDGSGRKAWETFLKRKAKAA